MRPNTVHKKNWHASLSNTVQKIFGMRCAPILYTKNIWHGLHLNIVHTKNGMSCVLVLFTKNLGIHRSQILQTKIFGMRCDLKLFTIKFGMCCALKLCTKNTGHELCPNTDQKKLLLAWVRRKYCTLTQIWYGFQKHDKTNKKLSLLHDLQKPTNLLFVIKFSTY